MVAGKAGNIIARSLSVMTKSIVGIDTVTNIAPYINGADQESNSALKMRFAAWILGLARGDYYGLDASIRGVDVTVQWTLTESYNYDGSYHPGYFFVVADDGSGTPPPAFFAMINKAAQAVRPLGHPVLGICARRDDGQRLDAAARHRRRPGVTSVSNVVLNNATGDAADAGWDLCDCLRHHKSRAPQHLMTIQDGNTAPTGSSANLAWRVWNLIPGRWFSWIAPAGDAIIGGRADSAAWNYSLIAYAKAQTRLATAYGIWLHILCHDYLGNALTRNKLPDDTFRALIKSTILHERVARQAMIDTITKFKGTLGVRAVEHV